MIKTPVRGMRDLLPAEMTLREYVLGIINEEAARAGYQKIETPATEPIENLTSKQGGENESLIFKVMKRGRSLESARENGEELADCGLRYDLTVPLSRYFANNQKDLPTPFKALQIGPVWRADRPQKGRFRQFVQCDMDILGDATVLAEIDTISTTAGILGRVFGEANIEGLTVRLNDRRILSAAAAYAGFSEAEYGSVLISLDKSAKIGLSGVREDLRKVGFDGNKVDKFSELFEFAPQVEAEFAPQVEAEFAPQVEAESAPPVVFSVEPKIPAAEFCKKLAGFAPDSSVTADLEKIAAVVSGSLGSRGKIVFDPTLVRGMGYYTGPIFECSAGGFSSSVAGGGRYDKMIGKISGGQDVAACGFSIGFERIVTILEDAGFNPERTVKRRAVLVDKNLSAEALAKVMARAYELRASGEIVSVTTMNKNVKYQQEMMEKNGFSAFEKVFA